MRQWQDYLTDIYLARYNLYVNRYIFGLHCRQAVKGYDQLFLIKHSRLPAMAIVSEGLQWLHKVISSTHWRYEPCKQLKKQLWLTAEQKEVVGKDCERWRRWRERGWQSPRWTGIPSSPHPFILRRTGYLQDPQFWREFRNSSTF